MNKVPLTSQLARNEAQSGNFKLLTMIIGDTSDNLICLHETLESLRIQSSNEKISPQTVSQLQTHYGLFCEIMNSLLQNATSITGHETGKEESPLGTPLPTDDVEENMNAFDTIDISKMKPDYDQSEDEIKSLDSQSQYQIQLQPTDSNQTKTGKKSETKDKKETTKPEELDMDLQSWTSSRIIVKGLQFNIDDKKLKQIFSQFGSIKSCQIIHDKKTQQSKGFGMIVYANPKSAMQAIRAKNGSRRHARTGMVLHVEPWKDKRDAQEDSPFTNVFTKHIPNELPTQDVLDLFQSVTGGKLKRHRFWMKAFGTAACLEFEHPIHAKLAVEKLHDYDLTKLCAKYCDGELPNNGKLYVARAQRKQQDGKDEDEESTVQKEGDKEEDKKKLVLKEREKKRDQSLAKIEYERRKLYEEQQRKRREQMLQQRKFEQQRMIEYQRQREAQAAEMRRQQYLQQQMQLEQQREYLLGQQQYEQLYPYQLNSQSYNQYQMVDNQFNTNNPVFQQFEDLDLDLEE